MMFWIVAPSDKETELRALYDLAMIPADEGFEKMGVPQFNLEGTKIIVGTGRATQEDFTRVAAYIVQNNLDWVDIYSEFPEDWTFPTE